MPTTIAVVDYYGEDLDPLINALYDIEDVEPIVTSHPFEIANADGVILAGKLSFAEAMAQIRMLGLYQPLQEVIVSRKPFLGIGIGLHLFYTFGMEVELGRSKNDDEQIVQGLNLRPGAVWDLYHRCGKDTVQPHVGFATVRRDVDCSTPLLEGIPEDDEYYFSHYFVAPTGPWVHGWTLPEGAEEEFPSVVDFGRTCFGIQFHPEESGEAGVRILRRFVEIAEESARAIEAERQLAEELEAEEHQAEEL